MNNTPELTAKQQAVLEVVRDAFAALSIKQVMHRCATGLFDSVADCKGVLTRLECMNLVWRQSNLLYKAVSQTTVNAKPATKAKKNAKQLPANKTTQTKAQTTKPAAKTSTNKVASNIKPPLWDSLTKLEQQLNVKPVAPVVVANFALKQQVLSQLANMLSDDIAEILQDIQADFNRALDAHALTSGISEPAACVGNRC